ncbi:MAG: S41 family peptidase [Planctomycetota bacterium]|nr:S41 family peptidase [Planctomycetota bacterium]
MNRSDVFDEIWESLDDRYPYFGHLDLDWEEIGNYYRPAAQRAAGNSIEFYHLLAGVLCELNDPHVSLIIPEENWSSGAEDTTTLRFKKLVLGQRWFVMEWPEGQEPLIPDHLEEGERNYPEIIGIEGYRFSPSLSHILLRGKAGSPVEFELQWADQSVSRHTALRPASSVVLAENSEVQQEDSLSNDDPSPSLLEEAISFKEKELGEYKVGHLKLSTFSMPIVDDVVYEQFEKRLDEFLDQARQADVLVIDLQGNPGGASSLLKIVASRFISEPIEIAKRVEVVESLWQRISVYHYETIEPQGAGFDLPVVVVVNSAVASAAEHLARILQVYTDALVMGTPTMGAESAVESVVAKDGSILRFGSIGYQTVRGSSFQDRGVIPDLLIKVDIEQIRSIGFEDHFVGYTERFKQQMIRAFETLNKDKAQ